MRGADRANDTVIIEVKRLWRLTTEGEQEVCVGGGGTERHFMSREGLKNVGIWPWH